MTVIRFVSPDGESVREVTAASGERLLEIAQNDGQPLEGTCEGQMACSTCHVVIAMDDFAKLVPPTELEEDMLDFAAGVTRYSRLACQIFLTDSIDSLTVTIPAEHHNMQGR